MTIRRFASRALASAAVVATLACVHQASAQQFHMTAEQFNAWLANGSEPSQSFATAQLSVELLLVQRASQLTDEQAAKLKLAGEGDVARFEERVDRLRHQLVGKTFPQEQIGEIYQQIQPLSQALQQGLFGDDSLYAKVLRQTLTREQRTLYEQAQQQRRARSYAAAVDLVIASLEQAAPMTSAQRTALRELILSETRPPKMVGQYDTYYAAVQFSTLSERKLAAILDPAQLKVARQTQQQGRGWKTWLAGMGIEPGP
jgi:hypothetical protein